MLLWGDPEYARRFVESAKLYDGDGFEVNEPLCTKMQAQAHDAKPFELLGPRIAITTTSSSGIGTSFKCSADSATTRRRRRKFGNMSLNGDLARRQPRMSSSAPPRQPGLAANCGRLLSLHAFPMTRGWAEKQRLGDLPKYSTAEGSDVAQFASFDEEAELLLKGGETAKVRPSQTSRWFAAVSHDVLADVAAAEAKIGNDRSKEFDSTVVDLKILANLAVLSRSPNPRCCCVSALQAHGQPGSTRTGNHS